MNCSILVGTYGGEEWKRMAYQRAYPSAIGQSAREVLIEHQPHGTIAKVRNALAEQADGEWLCFLDADDELGDNYLAGMERALRGQSRLTPLLLTPMVSYVERGRPQPPRFWAECDLSAGNWMVIGTLIEKKFFQKIGGFRDWGDPPGSNAYEDWALWATASSNGAQILKAHHSIYIAHKERTSRHRYASPKIKSSWHREIGQALFPERYGV